MHQIEYIILNFVLILFCYVHIMYVYMYVLNVLNDYMSKTDKNCLFLLHVLVLCIQLILCLYVLFFHFEGNIFSTIYKHVYTLDYFRTVVKGVIS